MKKGIIAKYFKNNQHTNLVKELIRVLVYLLIVLLYLFTGIIGGIIALFHFILILHDSKKYGMSRFVNKIKKKVVIYFNVEI